MKKGLIIVVLFSAGILIGLGYGSAKAADVEIILGTSSGFKIVRGTSVSAGTSTFFVGSSTVSIGTTTQAAMLTIAGSSTSSNDASLRVRNSSGADALFVRNDGAILIGTNTSNLNSALYVGSATSGSLGTITGGYLSMGTISANTGLHGTTTVRFLADIFANGTITTGTKFVGDGSSLTGITATSLGSTSNINTTGTINAGSTTVSTLTTTGSATVTGTLTAASNNFVVGSTGSMTASSITVSTGTLTVASGAFKVDETGSMTAARVTASSMTVTTGTLTAASGAFKVDENGSMTATTITSTGSVTASTLSIAGTATMATTSGNVGIGTTTPSTLFTVGTTTNILNVTRGGNVGIGTTTPAAKLDVAGGIKSTLWKVTQVFNDQPGGLPLAGTFTTGGGTLLTIASGMGKVVPNGNFVPIGMNILLDGTNTGSVRGFPPSATGEHAVFSTNALVVTGIAAGTHSLVLAAINAATVTDGGDIFNVTVLELPF